MGSRGRIFKQGIKMLLNKCCFCVPHRTGNIIMAILGILGGVSMIGASKSQYDHTTSVVDGIFHLVAYGFLLHGALENNKKSVLISIICTGVVVAFGLLVGLIAVANIDVIVPALADGCKNWKEKENINDFNCDDSTREATNQVAAMFFVSGLISIYFWICSYSFYQELKKNQGFNGVSENPITNGRVVVGQTTTGIPNGGFAQVIVPDGQGSAFSPAYPQHQQPSNIVIGQQYARPPVSNPYFDTVQV